MFWMLTAWAHWAPPPSDSLKLMFPSWYCPHFHQQEIKTGVTLRSAVGTHRYVPGLVSSLTPSITLSPSSVMSFCFLSSVLSPSSSHCFSPHFFLVLFKFFCKKYIQYMATWLHIYTTNRPSVQLSKYLLHCFLGQSQGWWFILKCFLYL